MTTLELNEETPPPWQQSGSLPAAVANDLKGILRTDGEEPWGLFVQQEAFGGWAERCGTVIERKSITGTRYRGGVEHEIVEDGERERVIKITHPGQYGHLGSCQWGKLELVQAKPLEYLARLDLVNQLFRDDNRILGAIRHSSGARIVSAQPMIRGDHAEKGEVIEWMRSLGFAAAGQKTYWNANEGLAIFDAHPGNVLRIPDGRLCPIDIIPCIADARMASFLNQRVKAWAAKH
ncbi:MAG TPA: hypothetical protein VHM91_05135 [Verrucomicrobiales bacterium]|nr:hypothetical protein [Verrucomicrobiales bacterium]